MQTVVWDYGELEREIKMNDLWIEERAETIRMALRIVEFPDAADLWRLVDWLGANVRIYHEEVDAGCCQHHRSGRHFITLPSELPEQPLTWELAHEIGHALLTAGVAAILRQIDPDCPRVERLAQRWEAQDERRARDFVLAWFMPYFLVRSIPCDSELAWRAGVTPEMAYQRRQGLGVRGPEFEGRLPKWSAGQEYHCIVQQFGRRVALYVARRASVVPVFDFPTSPRTLDEDALQVNADLVALTSREFELKYADFTAGVAEVRPIDLTSLRTWSRAGGRR